MTAAALEPLLAAVRAQITDPARQALVAQMTADAATLGVRQLAGEDVTAEFRHLEAQGLLLAAAEAQIARNALLEWAQTAIATAIRGVFAAAGGVA